MALQCARPLALWPQVKHSIAAQGTALQCSPLRTRCRALSARCRKEDALPCSTISRRRSLTSKVLASDSQAQDEEQEEVVMGEDGTISNEEMERLMGKYNQDMEPPSRDDSAADSDALTLVMALASAANEVKAVELKVLYVKPLVYWTRYFIIASAYSMPQINAISGKMEKLCKDEFKILSRTTEKASPWTLLDFGDVVVHIFTPQQRRRYNLEEFYANAPVVELPFETETYNPEYLDIEDEYEEEFESDEDDEEDYDVEDDDEEDDEEYIIDSGDEEQEEELGAEDAASESEFEGAEEDEDKGAEEDEGEDDDDSETKPRLS